MTTSSIFEKISSKGYDLVNKLPEQDFISYKKVKAFSEQYIVHCVAKALVSSIAISYLLGFSFSVVFPACLIVIVSTTFIQFAINNIKAAISSLAKKGANYLTKIAQVIANIFEKSYSFISSFFRSTTAIHLIPTNNKQFQIKHATSELINPKEEIIPEMALPLATLLPIAQSATILEENTVLNTYIIEEAPKEEDSQTIVLSELEENMEEIVKPTILSHFEKVCKPSDCKKVELFKVKTFQGLSLKETIKKQSILLSPCKKACKSAEHKEIQTKDNHLFYPQKAGINFLNSSYKPLNLNKPSPAFNLIKTDKFSTVSSLRPQFKLATNLLRVAKFVAK